MCENHQLALCGTIPLALVILLSTTVSHIKKDEKFDHIKIILLCTEQSPTYKRNQINPALHLNSLLRTLKVKQIISSTCNVNNKYMT